MTFVTSFFFFCSILWLGVAIGGGGWVVTVHWCEWGNAIKQRATGYTSPKPLCGKCGLEALYRYPLVTIRISVAKLCSQQYKNDLICGQLQIECNAEMQTGLTLNVDITCPHKLLFWYNKWGEERCFLGVNSLLSCKVRILKGQIKSILNTF